MSTESNERGSLTELTSEVARKAANLVLAHGELLQVELRENAFRTARALSLWMAGYVVLVFGVLFVLVAIGFYLQDFYSVHPSIAWGVVGFVLLLISVSCLVAANYQIRHMNLVPIRTVRSVKESFAWRK